MCFNENAHYKTLQHRNERCECHRKGLRGIAIVRERETAPGGGSGEVDNKAWKLNLRKGMVWRTVANIQAEDKLPEWE